MSYFLAALVIVDGLVTRNPSPWAGLPRALMALSIVAVAILELYRAGERLDVLAAVIVGIVAAMVISDSYRAIVSGLALWIVYLGAFALARAVTRDWAGDVARAGVIVAVFAVVMRIWPPPGGAWNSNVIGAVLVVCLAASFSDRKFVLPLAILVGILATGSRGAMAGAFVAWCVMFYARALLAAPALAGGLIWARPLNSSVRVFYWYAGIKTFLSNLAFGVGPGRLQIPEFDGRSGFIIHAHNSLITLAAEVGLVGLVVMAAFIALGRSHTITRAALAALAGVATHAIVDDPIIAMPVGLMLVLLMANTFKNSDACRHP